MDIEELPRLPVEIWNKIFDHLRGNESPKSLVKYRQVCKLWRQLIDDNFDFNVTLNDDKMDVSNLSHLKVGCCVIKKFMKALPENHVDIFQDSHFLSKLFIWGPISLENFQKLMTWATNVLELSITKEPMFMDPGLISTAKGLDGLWGKLQKLTIDLGWCSRWRNWDQNVIVPNLLDALDCHIPNLKMLSLRIYASNLETAFEVSVYILSFLGAHPNLVQLQLHMDFEIKTREYFNQLHNIPCPAITNDIERKLTEIKLASLTLSAKSYILPYWKSAIQLMRSLKILKVTVTDGENKDVNLPEANLLNFLESRLVDSHSTLTSIEFSKVHIIGSVNAIYFRGMKNLKRLVLRCNQPNGLFERSKIVNLKMLPVSIEVLCIHDVHIGTEDLYLVAARLENIRDVELTRTGNGNGFGVSNEVLERFARKQNIQIMRIFPVINSSGNVIVRVDDNVIKTVNILNDKGAVSFDFNEFRKNARREANV